MAAPKFNPWSGNHTIVHLVNKHHVADDFETVKRAVQSAIHPSAWEGFSDLDRRQILEAAEEVHRENRKVYTKVIQGRL